MTTETMTHKLKFRVFDSINKEMIYATLEEIAMSALEDDCMSDDSESGTRASKFNDIMFGRFGHVKCEPMQYTGATDIRSQKIFEGDIVKGGGLADEKCTVVWDESNLHFRLSDTESGTRGIFLSAGMALEVVGSIPPGYIGVHTMCPNCGTARPKCSICGEFMAAEIENLPYDKKIKLQPGAQLPGQKLGICVKGQHVCKACLARDGWKQQ
jgi:hypothetical protein